MTKERFEFSDDVITMVHEAKSENLQAGRAIAGSTVQSLKKGGTCGRDKGERERSVHLALREAMRRGQLAGAPKMVVRYLRCRLAWHRVLAHVRGSRVAAAWNGWYAMSVPSTVQVQVQLLHSGVSRCKPERTHGFRGNEGQLHDGGITAGKFSTTTGWATACRTDSWYGRAQTRCSAMKHSFHGGAPTRWKGASCGGAAVTACG